MWVQVNHNGENEVRVVTHQDTCPVVNIDGQPSLMETRVSGDNGNYPILVCKKTLPKTYANFSVLNQTFSHPLEPINKIAIIGDTGCRDSQNINDPEQWPFPQIVENISRHNPDLVIHLGDYIYQRDSRYNSQITERDKWEHWKTEFFDPADKLLKQAPWLFLRGNIEFLKAKEGWMKLVSAYPYSPFLVQEEEPFWVDSIEGVSLLAHDSSAAHRDFVSNVESYRSKLRKLDFSKDDKNVWLLTHRPLVGIVTIKNKNDNKESILSDSGYGLEVFKEIHSKLRFVVSGHIHTFQYIKAHQLPDQFVMGNGGVRLEKVAAPTILDNTIIQSQIIEKGMTINQFGYGILERHKEFWLLSLYSAKNTVLARCTIGKKESRCEFGAKN
ncbi:MAG: metallophosphoesterase [Alphaproteobacteria bacterium]|nr:metallophosphoesterase [Alphaproteobacteria bacterium]